MKGTNNNLVWNMQIVCDMVDQVKTDRNKPKSIDIKIVADDDGNTGRHGKIVSIKVIETEEQLNHVRSLAPLLHERRCCLRHSKSWQ